MYQRQHVLLQVACLTVLLLVDNNEEAVLGQSCHHFQPANVGWFTNVWSTYSEKRFKETFRLSRSTFMFVLGLIRNANEKDTITEELISPEAQIAI